MRKKLNRNQKIAVGLLAAAVLALGVDRLFLGGASGPESAVAEPQSPEVMAGVSALAAGPGRTSLADRLTQWKQSRVDLNLPQMRDAFVPDPSWVAGAEDELQAAKVRFEQTYRLTSLLLAGPDSCAIVNDQVVRLGQEVDGFRLIRLSVGRAAFQAGDEVITLRLEEPDAIE